MSPASCAGVVFDMDGTLTVSNIDYTTMRQKTGIPVGDLFTVMESWDDGDRIKRSMETILELEAQASASLEPMPGLLSLLAFLRASGIKVGLVTRNTTESLNAFFAGESCKRAVVSPASHWAGLAGLGWADWQDWLHGAPQCVFAHQP